MRSSLYTLQGFRAALAISRFAPRSFTHALARLLAARAAPADSAAFGIIRENLRVVTGLSGRELDDLCRKNISDFSRSIADYFLFTARDADYAPRLVSAWSGWDHIVQARAAGRGIILVTGHLGHWELGGVLLALRGVPMTVITLEEPSTELTRWRDAYRQRLGIKTIAVGPGREFGFVEMIQVLKRNECLAMLVDRPYSGTGLPVTFFGHSAEFSSAPALLWQHTGAAVVPAFVTRNRTDDRYTSFAEPAVPLAVAADKRAALQSNTQKIASVFEDIIRRFPGQWFNYAPAFSLQVPREPASSSATQRK